MAIRDLSILLSDEESDIRTSALELIELLLKECSVAQLRPFALSLRIGSVRILQKVIFAAMKSFLVVFLRIQAPLIKP